MQHKLINVDTVHSERVFNVYILAEHLGMHAPLFFAGVHAAHKQSWRGQSETWKGQKWQQQGQKREKTLILQVISTIVNTQIKEADALYRDC